MQAGRGNLPLDIKGEMFNFMTGKAECLFSALSFFAIF